MTAKISIIIPLFNKEEFIEQAITSVNNQSFKDYEVIIVNDGSTDNSLAIAEIYASDKISIYTTENKGVSHARNYGVSQSNAELIAFLDADDVWLPNHLEELYNLYESHPDCGLYACNYDKIFFNRVNIKTMFKTISNDFYGIIGDYFKASIIDSIAWTSAIAIPKSIFEKNSGFNPKLKSAEDTDLWIRLALRHKIAFSSKVTSQKKIYHSKNHLSKTVSANDALFFTNQFLDLEKKNKSLKHYLDLNRFSFAIDRKINNDISTYKKLRAAINFKNLNLKQRLLLNLSTGVLKRLVYIKDMLIKEKLYTSPFK